MMNTDSHVFPVWQMQVTDNGSGETVSMRSKYHCFVENKSLCGTLKQTTSFYDDGISMESAAVLDRPDVACKLCLRKWKRLYQIIR